jgi:Bacteriophage Gp15 protein
MIKLTSTFEDSFEFEGNTLNLDLSFDNILLLFEMLDDDDLDDFNKILIALQMLIYECEEYLSEVDFEVLRELFKYILKEFLYMDIDKEEEEQNKSETLDPEEEQEAKIKFMDYKKDAGIIYASFLAEYGIDLFEQQGKLHWLKFKELVTHLSDKSKLKQVISYRTTKVPTGKNVDQEAVKHLKKMKRIYSLENPEVKQTTKARNAAFDAIAEALKSKAKLKT